VAQYWSPGVTPSARPRPRGCALQPTATHYTPPAARQATPAHTAMARHLISRRRRWGPAVRHARLRDVGGSL
jgi:hypothetical protein